MATPSFNLPVTAAQVGTYFVGHYYQVLQSQPDFVHQFYSDGSTVLRVDGINRETATSMLQIHALVMSLNYTGIEIRTVNALESWDRGVLVLVSGSVHVKDYNSKRNFVQTFFLAPQEKGFFVLNDIFHFIDDQPIHHLPVAYMNPNDLVSNFNASTAVREQGFVLYCIASLMLTRIYFILYIAFKFIQFITVVENGAVKNYSFQEQQLQATGAESVLENGYVGQANGSGSVQNSVIALQENMAPVEEVVREPQKHTYASILQAAKGHSAPSAPTEQPVTKSTVSLELNHRPEPSGQQTFAASAEVMDDISAVDDEAEVKSIYVKNVPSTASVSDIEEEFKRFGKIRPDGVAIRTRKDLDMCYAFVEFEDITSVHNAIEASTVEIGGQQVYIEGRRANRSNAYRGGGIVGRGRFGGRNYSNSNRGNGHDDNGYSRPRGNGYHRRPRLFQPSPGF
ncbi:nuclear transport factor 2-like isoform X1 [Bidens hawaiensis]|uniref:nuclear transport factor 2-like isoform X1 n=1 Tax=Bidens hawaiensis TaxID=980011 RepID=UPI00404A8816